MLSLPHFVLDSRKDVQTPKREEKDFIGRTEGGVVTALDRADTVSTTQTRPEDGLDTVCRTDNYDDSEESDRYLHSQARFNPNTHLLAN